MKLYPTPILCSTGCPDAAFLSIYNGFAADISKAEDNADDLRKKYLKEFSSKPSNRTVVMFYQPEYRSDLVDLELTSRLPSILDEPSNP